VEVISDRFQPMWHSRLEVVQVTRPALVFQSILMVFWREVMRRSRWQCLNLQHSRALFLYRLTDGLQFHHRGYQHGVLDCVVALFDLMAIKVIATQCDYIALGW